MGKGIEHGEGKRVAARFRNALALCAICIVVNILGAQIALALKLPVYLDSLGTIMAGVLGGYVPAIVVGYVTNLINSIADSSTMYYGIINVLIALFAAFIAKRGWFKSFPLILLSILVFALIGGGLGSVLTYFLYGAGIGDGISAPFAHQLYDNGVLDVFGAQLCADLFIDFIDKALTVLTVALVYHLMSEDFLAKLDFVPWQQTPLSQAELEETMSAKPRTLSLQTKFVVIVGSIMAFVAITTTTISYLTFHQSMIEAESANAMGITSLMTKAVNPDRIDEYMTDGENAPGYRETEQRLADIRDSFPGVRYVYVYQIQKDGCHVVFDPDTADEPGSDPGDVVPFDPSFQGYVPTLLAGGEIDPIVSNDSYGWLLTVYTPLKNSAGTTVCYLAADISMEQLVADESSFLASIIALFAAFFVLICGVVLWLAKYGIILPVNSISRASNNFMLGDESVRSLSADQIEALGIRTGDEIENLFDAVNQMSQEAVRYTADAQEKSETISRMQDNLIMVMADLVESRDKFTGDHVRNTAAYTRIVMNQMRREGIYPDILTNEFISNVYKSAPLHDVGKIAVSDTILNKPGRFTDEEFEIMKNHTIAGKEILESAKGAVSEAGYLDEAQRLAAYHHEKWNGSGYPYGLAGEDIPLSARIMAVADVFDALVSKRSYKEGFPIEKALAIIEEGIGTHFDPQVARAFLHAQDKARAVAEKSNAKKQAEEEAAAAKAAQEAANKDADTDTDTP
ncbi:MAG: HD domain-containing protein [Eggerthellaceae bacterium]|nr:HD domain-containing protein [Eggerthellaceae bacterium]